MWKDDLPGSAVGVLIALVCAVFFALSFLWEYSPERLLSQALLGAVVVDGFRPLLVKLSSGVVRTVSAIAYFTLRVLMLAVLSIWLFSRAPELISKAMSHDGWAFAFDVGSALAFGLIWAMAALLTLFGIVFPVWGDAFGSKAQDG